MKHLILLVLIISIMLSGCDNLQNDTLPEPRIVYGLTLMPSGFDPHINASAELGIPLRSVYDTLVYRDPDTGEFVPGLAARWEMSEDGLTYTFFLRTDVKFHDDTRFDAAAVGINIDRIINPDTGSQKARFMLGPLTGYQIIDDHTITLNLSAPYAPFLDSLCQVYTGIASPAQLEKYDNGTYQFHQVGTGPFRMVELVPGDHVTLTRNKDYAWGPSFYIMPDNPVQTIEFKFYEDPPTRSLALESGEAQVMGELQPVDAQLLSGNPDIRLYPTTIPGQPLQFMMNTQRFPTDSRAVRQALLFATNRAAVVDTVFRRFSPVAFGPVSQGTDFYYDQVATTYPYDLGQAESLLFAAGFTETNDDGILFIPTGLSETEPEATPAPDASLSGVALEVTMVVPPWGLAPQVAQLLQSQWRDAGIDLKIEQVAGFGQLREAASAGNFNLIAINFFGRDPSVLDQFFTSDGSMNWAGYADIELDTYLEEGTRQTEASSRASMYAAAQARIMDQALILPIREYTNLNGASTNLVGVAFDTQGWFPLLHNFGLE